MGFNTGNTATVTQRTLEPHLLINPTKRLGKRILGRHVLRNSLPDFIIIGTQKGGTTSLFHYLSQHPELVASSEKEVHFFDSGGTDVPYDSFAQGLDWYEKRFPFDWSTTRKKFEASPLYLFHPLAPARIHAALPKVKLIALLRNPTDRAVSHYYHQRKVGKESLTLQEAIEAESSRLKKPLEDGDYKSETFVRHSYVQRGYYAEQLARYFQYFSPDQVLVASSEEFFSSPGEVIQRVLRFVEVDASYQTPDLNPKNIGHNKEEAPADLVAKLDDVFQKPNQELYDLLGRTFEW